MPVAETVERGALEKSTGSRPAELPVRTGKPGLNSSRGPAERPDDDLPSDLAGQDTAGDVPPAQAAAGPSTVSELAKLAGLLDTDAGELRLIPVGKLRPSKFQPRRHFEEAEIQALAESIKQHGLLQPILVRPVPGSHSGYEIVFGERRWRAATLAGLDAVPALVRDVADNGALVSALVENLQRQNLTAIEEAEGYRRLVEEFELTQDELATLFGKSRSAIANALRLLHLPAEIKEALQTGELTAGHARALINADDPLGLARKVMGKNLSVRQTECLARKPKSQPGRQKNASPAGNVDIAALESVLSDLLGLRATVAFNGKSGSLTLHYDTLEQLDDFIGRIEAQRTLTA